jgi:uncharacterized protein (DUF433 family)
MRSYGSWKQVAGYFDGDGDIYFSDTTNQPYRLSLTLIFSEQSLEQVQMIKEFLNRNGVITSNILKTSLGTAYMIAISRFDHVLRTMKELLPHLYKKANEIRAAIDYYEGRITGNQLLTVFNQEVEAGRRERHPRKVPIDVLYTYPDGDAMMKERHRVRLKDAFGRFRAKMTPEDYARIRHEYYVEGKRQHEIAKEYPQYARETVRRVLGKDRGYVGVKGKGMVCSTEST